MGPCSRTRPTGRCRKTLATQRSGPLSCMARTTWRQPSAGTRVHAVVTRGCQSGEVAKSMVSAWRQSSGDQSLLAAWAADQYSILLFDKGKQLHPAKGMLCPLWYPMTWHASCVGHPTAGPQSLRGCPLVNCLNAR